MTNTFKQYPSNDLERPEAILNVLGSFWSSVYHGRDFVSDVVNSKARLCAQTYQNLLEMLASVSRLDVPVFHREYWTSLIIRESQFEKNLLQSRKFAPESNTYGDPTLLVFETYYLKWANAFLGWSPEESFQFGELTSSKELSAPKSASLIEAPLILNRMLNPSVVLSDGVDYVTHNDRIEFYSNPFQNDKITKRDILAIDGSVVDREIVLWIYHGKWDLEYIYQQFGYALGIYAKSSDNYKQLVNAILDATVSGTSVRAQQLALAAVTGMPLVIEETERVEYIHVDEQKTQVITDQHVYTYPANASISVTPGQLVRAGMSLTDDFKIYELNRGGTQLLQDFQYLTMSTALLAFDGFGSLTFRNIDTPIVSEVDADGKLRVSWQLIGFPPDIATFWQEVRRREDDHDLLLADLLDTRPSKVTPVRADNIPSTVNPLRFLVENVLRFNFWVLRIRQRSSANNPIATASLEHFRRIQPPHTCLLVVQELIVDDDVIHPEDVESPIGYWYSESVSEFTPTDCSETLGTDLLSGERLDCYYLDGGCQT